MNIYLNEQSADPVSPPAAQVASCSVDAHADASAQQTDGEIMQLLNAYAKTAERLQSTHEALTSQVDRLRNELASANVEMQRSRRLAALGEMAAGIAHEIRNPLGAMQLYAQALCDDLADRPDHQQLAQHVLAGVRNVNAIVTDVLNFARELKMRITEQPIAPILQQAVATVQPMMDQHQVTLACPALEDDDIFWHVDGTLLNQAIVNLMRNAVQAMPDGGEITVELVTREQDLEITIADTGPGIDAEAIDRIFNPFFTTRETGTGLGLAIVHRIVDAHGGTISVDNDPAAGARFVLSFPHRPQQTQTQQPVEQQI